MCKHLWHACWKILTHCLPSECPDAKCTWKLIVLWQFTNKYISLLVGKYEILLWSGAAGVFADILSVRFCFNLVCTCSKTKQASMLFQPFQWWFFSPLNVISNYAPQICHLKIRILGLLIENSSVNFISLLVRAFVGLQVLDEGNTSHIR